MSIALSYQKVDFIVIIVFHIILVLTQFTYNRQKMTGRFCMPIDYKQLGKNIYAVRKKHKLTQQGLAEMLDYSPEHISQLEHGNRPIQLEALNQICEKLDVSFGDLLLGATAAKILPNGELSENNTDTVAEFSKIICGCSPKRIEYILSICRILASFPR